MSVELDYMEYATDGAAQAAYVGNDTTNLQSYSESTIKTQGSYALKAVAAQTDSLNDTLTRTISSPIDLSDQETLKLDVRSDRTGENLEFQYHNLDSNCVLLMHMDGADDGTTFSDSSTANNKGNASITGDVVTKTAVKKWGTASAYFDGTGDKLTFSNNADYNFVGSSSQDYTIDFWCKFTDHTGTERFINQYDTVGGVNNFSIYHKDGDGFYLYIKIANVTKISIYGGEITDTDWHHVAVCKVTSAGPTVEWGIYVDGTQVAYGSDATTMSITSDLWIGADDGVSSAFDGYMDEYRIQKSNIFDASPNSTPDDTITVPTRAYNDYSHIIDIDTADVFQTESIDISDIPNAGKDAIDKLVFKVINADT